MVSAPSLLVGIVWGTAMVVLVGRLRERQVVLVVANSCLAGASIFLFLDQGWTLAVGGVTAIATLLVFSFGRRIRRPRSTRVGR